jgi:hypothetical protein
MNQSASDAIRPAPERDALPKVGEMVVYHMRQGYARQGRTSCPAVVQGHGDRGTLALTVIVDAQDFNDETLVEEYGVGQEFHAWERVAPVGSVAGVLLQLQALAAVVDGIEKENKELLAMIAAMPAPARRGRPPGPKKD